MSLRFVYECLDKDKGLVMDSRGESVQVGDVLMNYVDSAIYGQVLCLGMVEKDNNFRNYINYTYSGHNYSINSNDIKQGVYAIKLKSSDVGYWFKLKSEFTEHLHTFYGYSCYTNEMANLIKVGKSEEEMYKLKNGKNTIRDMQMSDVLHRDLRPYSFVYYIEDYKLKHGLVVSSKHVYTQDSGKKVIKHVIVVSDEELTMDETQEKNRLYKEYQNTVKEKIATKHKVGYQVGDIYTTDYKFYMYLGKCDISFAPYMEVVTAVSYRHDKTKECWVVGDLAKYKANGLNNKDDIISLLKSVLLINSKLCTVSYANISRFIKASYFNVTNFDCFKEKLPSQVKYLCNVGNLLKSGIEIKYDEFNENYVQMSTLRGYKVQIKFK